MDRKFTQEEIRKASEEAGIVADRTNRESREEEFAEALREFREAYKERARLKAEVEDWMHIMTQRGRFDFYSDAPMWGDYENAGKRVYAAVIRLGEAEEP